MSTEGLTPRAASLLRTLVGMHIREGQPVGSKALHVESGMSVSTATIRNVMSDLEERGLLSSPHTSAGRIPTAQGYRLFVDSLLQTSPIDASALQALKHELNPNRTSSDLIASASNLLTQVTAQAGIVTVPRPTASQLRQIEFLPLSDSRVLVILVVNEREVQNRVIELSRPLSEEQLKVAAELINQRYAGNNLSEVKRMLVAEMADARTRI
ncbi:MAG TPA: heat-inducible transcription repressor HrcA, partial [Halieaceae bacterium]|nr:heat-inducible transcription repressor HrcA [Halieaceae bacterium]